jgi:hypothetical protein
MQKDDTPPSHAVADPADLPPPCPSEPDASDCCGEGCVPCVFDIYEQALARYRLLLTAWQARQA